ncbi:phage tail protein [Photorhabdus temperata]|uniref:Phage tail fiber n=1 Tax=Photorhabdus temperata subsp. temperata Meg1 TaxID=1393735 RepID=A0A081RW36_PHOTE|nr:phage tail protein [Photorhabdus temperata]KER02889.1 Phage tail fiber [Photorhabdus temperata subsp. temperata Meg1]MCT8347599.1 phage tail protein [Photorhabdus temperata]
MSPKNDFKAFSISDNANVVSQERYEENEILNTGFPPESITIHVLNKALRQSSTISSVVANFIATQSGNDVLDDGNIEKLTAQLNRALEQKTTTKIPDASLTQKGIIQLTDVIGNSNTLTATQKLVSDVNDNANGRLAKNQNGADIPNKNEFVKNLGLLELLLAGTPLFTQGDNFMTFKIPFLNGLERKYILFQSVYTKAQNLANEEKFTITYPIAYSYEPHAILSSMGGFTGGAKYGEGADILKINKENLVIISHWQSRSTSLPPVRIFVVGVSDN